MSVRTSVIVGTLVALLLSSPVSAQPYEPRHMAVGLLGIVMVGVGGALIVRTDPCCCRSNTGFIVAGGIVAGVGGVLVLTGMRARRVTVAPMVSHGTLGAVSVVRWR